MAKKKKTVDPSQVVISALWAKEKRKVSFAFTCERIRRWAEFAAERYHDGSQPSAQDVAWLAGLVKELASGTSESRSDDVSDGRRLRVTRNEIAQTVHLERKSMGKYTPAWGPPLVPDAGRAPAIYDFLMILPVLKTQFPHVHGDDWNKLAIDLTSI